MFGIGGGEILVIALVAVIVFGTDDLPKNMRKFMKALNNFRGVTNDLQRGWLDIRDQVTRDILIEDAERQKTQTQEIDSKSAAQAPLESSGSEPGQQLDTKPVDNELSELPDATSLVSEAYPIPRQAAGALARGELDDTQMALTDHTNSKVDPDKST